MIARFTERSRFPAHTVPLLSLLFVAATCQAADYDRIAELLSIKPGMWVADIGAGDGEWTFDLSERVGPEGHVYSTEVDREKLEKIRKKAESRHPTNISTVLGNQADTGLPENSCDRVLIRLVYHHFTQPEKMQASIWRAMKSGGLLGIIDFGPSELRPVEGVPENRGGHGIQKELVIEELTRVGFELVEEVDDWEGRSNRYGLLFRKP